MDVNQPDSKGKLPLLEAVRTRDIKYVDGLLQFRALAASVDPATGTTPLLEAFKLGLTEVREAGWLKGWELCTSASLFHWLQGEWRASRVSASSRACQ
jgi:hypothetical protein